MNKGICMTERSDPLVDRFDEAYIVEKTVDLVHGDDSYRIEIVRDLKHRGAARPPRATRPIPVGLFRSVDFIDAS